MGVRAVGVTMVRTRAAAGFLAALLTTAIGLAPAGTAHAVPGAVDGYVWADQQSTVDYTISHGWAHNSTGGDIEIHRPSAGTYQIRFVGMAGAGGVAHARPYGSGSTAICVVVNWRPSAGDQIVNVRCFDSGGAAADTRFVASFTNGTAAAAGTLAYLWADVTSPPIDVPYSPSAAYSYDSTGVGPQVWRQAVGVYMMLIGTVDAHYPVDHRDGVYQVTAYGKDPVRCEVHGENDEQPTPIAVFCVDEDGTPTDTRFAVTYAHGANVLGTGATAANAHYTYHNDDPTTWYLEGFWNTGGAPTLTRLAVGRYRVTFPGLVLTGGHATAGARGNPFAYCQVSSWSPGAVTVHCYDNSTDAPVDSEFGVVMTD
jgi:hypothetical protein